jgi:RNA polymerase sigma-70 factor (ECF subfamily)
MHEAIITTNLFCRIIIAIYFEMIKDSRIKKSGGLCLGIFLMAWVSGVACSNLCSALGKAPGPAVTTSDGGVHLSVQDDKKLVSQCLAGSESAWAGLYQRIYKQVYFITHWKKWNFSFEEAEELKQDVFMGLVTSLKAFKFDCSLETYAANIARKRCITELRKITAAKRESGQESVSIYETDEDDRPRVILEDKQSSFADKLVAAEQREQLQAVVNMIGERCREIIRLKYYENRSYEEIVAILRVPLGTVASRLKRCLLELRSLIEKSKGDLL